MSKARLLNEKKMLMLAYRGYELLDKKVYILHKEISDLKEKRKRLNTSIKDVLKLGHSSIKEANMAIGLNLVLQATKSIHIDDTLEILPRSIMGVEVALVSNKKRPQMPLGVNMHKGIYEATKHFEDIKKLCILLAMVEISIQNLNKAKIKTETRVNALKNLIIPRQTILVENLEQVLEEQEREERGRLNIINS